MKSCVLGFVLFSAATIVAGAPAQAQSGSLTRSFVSSAGLDTNPCTITQPCATFAVAYTKISANGIIAALDPGKYGPLTITTGVTVNGNGWSAITAPAAGNGITINSGSGNVTLIGLEIDGAQTAYNGIFDNSAGSLTVTNCILQNFFYNSLDSSVTGNGIVMQPTSGTLDFTITNTTASNNGAEGILYHPPSGSTASANGVIDHVVLTANVSQGMNFYTGSATSGTTVLTVSNSISSNNQVGIIVNTGGSSSTPIKVSIDNVTANSNQYGVQAFGNASVLLGRSVITNNTIMGVQNGTSSNTFYSFGNNQIGLNATDGIAGLDKATYPLE